MASKRANPVLFEVARPGVRQPAREGVAPAPAEDRSGAPWWQWAGRSLRVPMGYVFVAAAVVLIAGVLGYVVGYQRADAEARREMARRASMLPTSDPLAGASSAPGLIAPRAEDPPAQRRAQEGGDGGERAGPSGASGETGGARRTGAQTSDRDPREPGLNYFVVARDSAQQGRRMVDWLASKGVDAMIDAGGGSLVKVVVLRGFERGQTSSSDALAFKEYLRELGREWEDDLDGTTDFSDMYLEKHRP